MAVLFQSYCQGVINQQTHQWFQIWKIVLIVLLIKWLQVPAITGTDYQSNKVIGVQPITVELNLIKGNKNV
jgi:hypothetical protein